MNSKGVEYTSIWRILKLKKHSSTDIQHHLESLFNGIAYYYSICMKELMSLRYCIDPSFGGHLDPITISFSGTYSCKYGSVSHSIPHRIIFVSLTI